MLHAARAVCRHAPSMFSRGRDIVGRRNEPSPRQCSELLAWSRSQCSDVTGMVKSVQSQCQELEHPLRAVKCMDSLLPKKRPLSLSLSSRSGLISQGYFTRLLCLRCHCLVTPAFLLVPGMFQGGFPGFSDFTPMSLPMKITSYP